MDFPVVEGPTKMDCITSIDAESHFLIESSYADCHSKKTRSRGLCIVTNEKCCLQIVVNEN